MIELGDGRREELLSLLASMLVDRRMREAISSAFGRTPEFAIIRSLASSGSPMLLTELARANGLGRSSIVSYTKGRRRYEGRLRSALEGLVESSVVSEEEDSGRSRYALNPSSFDAMVLRQLLSSRQEGRGRTEGSAASAH